MYLWIITLSTLLWNASPAYCACSVSGSSSKYIRLLDKAGIVSYHSARVIDTCEWIFPKDVQPDEILYLRLESINMSYTYVENGITWTGCLGQIWLPEKGGRCSRRQLECLLYKKSGSKCEIQAILNHVRKNSPCTEYSWTVANTLPSRFQVSTFTWKAHIEKSFRLHYEYIDCNALDDLDTSGSGEFTTEDAIDANLTYTNTTIKEEASSSTESSSITFRPNTPTTSTTTVRNIKKDDLNLAYIIALSVVSALLILSWLAFVIYTAKRSIKTPKKITPSPRPIRHDRISERQVEINELYSQRVIEIDPQYNDHDSGEIYSIPHKLRVNRHIYAVND